MPKTFRLNLAFALLVMLSFTSVYIVSAEQNKASGILDGMVFIGQMGVSGEAAYDDKLSFANGQFWSEICIRCGFKPGKYWTRTEADGIHFRGELQGGFGEFVYEGRIIDGQAIVEVIWKKQRWYWTSGRTLAFEGSTIAGQSPYTANEAVQISIKALQGDLPDFCW